MPPTPHKYRLLWTAKAVPEGMTKSEIDELNETLPDDHKWAACDAITLISMIYPADGSYSQMLMPIDGRPEAKADHHTLDDHEVFKAWSILAERLARSKTLGPGKKGLASMVHEFVRDAVLRGRAEEALRDEPS